MLKAERVQKRPILDVLPANRAGNLFGLKSILDFSTKRLAGAKCDLTSALFATYLLALYIHCVGMCTARVVYISEGQPKEY